MAYAPTVSQKFRPVLVITTYTERELQRPGRALGLIEEGQETRPLASQCDTVVNDGLGLVAGDVGGHQLRGTGGGVYVHGTPESGNPESGCPTVSPIVK